MSNSECNRRGENFQNIFLAVTASPDECSIFQTDIKGVTIEAGDCARFKGDATNFLKTIRETKMFVVVHKGVIAEITASQVIK